MLGWRSRAASFASRWNRRTSGWSWASRNLTATQRVRLRSHAFHTAPMPPRPTCLTSMYWLSWREGSVANGFASAGMSSIDESAVGACFSVAAVDGQSWWKDPWNGLPHDGQMRDVDCPPENGLSGGSGTLMVSDTLEL